PRDVARVALPRCPPPGLVGELERLVVPALGEEQGGAGAVEDDRLVGAFWRRSGRVEERARPGEVAALDEHLGEQPERPLRPGRDPPAAQRLHRRPQLGLGLLEVAAEELGVAAEELHARHRERRAGAVPLGAERAPGLAYLVEVRERERERRRDG